jgi:hypothetical protein
MSESGTSPSFKSFRSRPAVRVGAVRPDALKMVANVAGNRYFDRVRNAGQADCLNENDFFQKAVFNFDRLLKNRRKQADAFRVNHETSHPGTTDEKNESGGGFRRLFLRA